MPSASGRSGLEQTKPGRFCRCCQSGILGCNWKLQAQAKFQVQGVVAAQLVAENTESDQDTQVSKNVADGLPAPDASATTQPMPDGQSVKADAEREADALNGAAPNVDGPLKPGAQEGQGTAGRSGSVPIHSFAPLLGLASEFLSQLASAVAKPETSALIERDPSTGRGSLRLPLPEPELLRRLAEAVQAMVPTDRDEP